MPIAKPRASSQLKILVVQGSAAQRRRGGPPRYRLLLRTFVLMSSSGDQILELLKALGIPALVAAGAAGVARFLALLWNRNSSEALLSWATSTAAKDVVAGDPAVAEALDELRRALAFERAFGIRAEREQRAQLVAFHRAHNGKYSMREVGRAARALRWNGHSYEPRSLGVYPNWVQGVLARRRRWAARHSGQFLLYLFGYVALSASTFLGARDVVLAVALALAAVYFAFLGWIQGKAARRMEVQWALEEWDTEVAKPASNVEAASATD